MAPHSTVGENTRSEANTLQLTCDLCQDYETYKKDSLELHVTMAHKYRKQEKSESHLAEKAEKINGGSAEKQESLTSATCPEQKPYVPRRRNSLFDCPKCIFRFLNADGRDSHLEKEHSPDDPYKDDPKHPDNIKKAEEAAKNGGNAPTTPPTREPYRPRGRSQLFKCPKCIYKFLNQEGLDSHLEKEHKPDDPDDENAAPPQIEGANTTYRPRRRSPLFDCKKCIYRFLSEDGLASHLEKEHKPEDPDIR